MDLDQYLDIFINESTECLQSLNEELLKLEDEPDSLDIIDKIFRTTHSLKGITGAMGYAKMQKLTHTMENSFSEIRSGYMVVNQELIDSLFLGLDALASYVDNIVETGDEGEASSEDIVDNINNIIKSQILNSEDIRDSQKIRYMDFPSNINSIDPKHKSLKPIASPSIRVDIEKLDRLMNLASELLIAKNNLHSLGSSNKEEDLLEFNENIEYLEQVTSNIHDSVLKLRMVPLENIFSRYPRMVRDLSKKLNKKIELVVSGKDVELDRTVIDEISDSLMHLIRNAADHGIEDKGERLKRGKPEIGTISLSAYQEDNSVVIEVEDDGGGININTVRQKAVDIGLYSGEDVTALEEIEIIDLLFKPSFSTSDIITEISGRGVGLDAVRTNISTLSGSIEAKSKEGYGTKFKIKLPLTLAIIQALMVQIGSEKYALPITNVQSVEEINASMIRQEEDKQVITLRNEIIPIAYLNEIIDLDEDVSFSDELTLLIIFKGDKKMGIVISELIGQQEIVVKSMGKHIKANQIIGGATILGNGELALILEFNSLL